MANSSSKSKPAKGRGGKAATAASKPAAPAPANAARSNGPLHQQKSTAAGPQPIQLKDIANLQILDEHGNCRSEPHPLLTKAELLRVYRAMVLTRRLDVRMLNMQRQGEMGTFAPSYGQEATQIGQVYPLRKKDWFAPSYRSFGAQLWRGWTIEGLMLLWDGFFEGFTIPDGVNDLPFSIVIGSHVPVAVGVSMAASYRNDDAVTVVNFGDGAISQGAVNEAFNFASAYKAPVIFICENNGYAISMKAEKQAGTDNFAVRGVGFGIPSVRVDGNDILAMIQAGTAAFERARTGGGPTLIEAVTYRMGVHTTADDPKVYRPDEEVEAWRAKCPIARFEKYLLDRKHLTKTDIERISEECEQEVLAGREAFRASAKSRPEEIFDFMFDQLPPDLQDQKRDYLARLKRKGAL